MVSYKHAHLRTCEIHVWLAMESVRASETKYGENSLETPRHKACSNTSRADMQTLRNPSSHKFLTSFFFFFADHSSEKTVNLTSHHARRCLCRTVVNSFSHRDTVRRDATRLDSNNLHKHFRCRSSSRCCGFKWKVELTISSLHLTSVGMRVRYLRTPSQTQV